MALKGDLASVDLAQVFQMLALNQKVGMLYIQSPRAWKALYFEPRGTTPYYNEHIMLDRVLLRLTSTGGVTEESAQEAREHAAHQNIHLSEVLLAGGYLSEPDYETAMRTELEEGIYDLFFWSDAHFEFFEGANSIEGREGVIDERFMFSTDSLIMEAARRIDEWSFIRERVTGPLEIYRGVKDNSNVLNLEESAMALFDLVDGKRNVGRLTEITGLPAFLVYKGLAQMLDEGIVEPVQSGVMIKLAQECVQEGRYQDAINLYEKAISESEGIPDSHRRVAEVYESTEEFELCAYHRKCVAEFHSGAGDMKKAAEILTAVVEMLPTDLAARERLVEITVGHPEFAAKGFDPVSHGKELVDLYLEIGEIDRVRGILERLLRDNPYDIELKKSLVNVHTKAGDTKRVIELYESIAEDLVQHRQPIEAVKYLQKILMLDRARKDISERIRSLYVMDERRRTRRRSLVALVVGLFVLVGLCGAYYLYDEYARERLAKIQVVVQKLVEAKEYGEAKEQYEAFIRQFPLTMVSQDVQGELTRIESLRRAHEAELDRQSRDRHQQLEKIRQSYKMAWTVYQGYVNDHRLDDALEQLETISRMVDKAGESVDADWAREVGLEKNRRDLKDYMSQALALDREAWEKYEAGDWLAARKLWVELITKFEMTQTAQSVRLPVMLRTRPEGAKVFYKGKPLVTGENGGQVQKTTPALVMCRWDEPETFELHREGFEPSKLVVDSKSKPTADMIMTVIPTNTFKFESPAIGAVSAKAGFLGVGLRGGLIALARINMREKPIVLKLPGLDELEGNIGMTSDSVVYATKEGYLASRSLINGASRWKARTRLDDRPTHGIVVQHGRILFSDTEGRVLAYDVNRGHRIWATPLNGTVSGALTVTDRVIRVGLRSGVIVLLDVTRGSVLKRLRAPGGVASAVEARNGALVFALDDGRVVAVKEANGVVVWTHKMGKEAAIVALRLVGESVIVVDNKGHMVKLGLRDGSVEETLELPGLLQSGPEIGGSRMFITVREPQLKKMDSDVLQAIEYGDLTVAWEYRDGGQFKAGVSVQGSDVFLTDSKGEVKHFR